MERAVQFALALGIAASPLASSATLAVEPVRAENLEERGKALTGKEKLSDKAADEQRVNDCKVAPARRGKATRSTECEAAPNETSRRDTIDRR